MRAIITSALVLAAVLLASGCGDSEKGKFRDQKDRPKSADKAEK